jgi:hypothetical protein
MFSTKSVQALHHLFKGYHQPTSLSPQKSVKLLEGIKASFRKQLDREYGPASETPSASPKQADAAHTERDPAAIQHLKSILTNPLFLYDKNAAPASSTLVTTPKQDPAQFFDHAVARGIMTRKAATGCLITKKRQLSMQPRAKLAPSGMAARVVRWLRSSGEESSLSFVEDRNFLYALTPFLVAEGLEEEAWGWITRVMKDDALALDEMVRVHSASYMLSQLVRAQCQPQHGSLNSAITTILRAEQEFKNHPLLPRLLVLPWRSVSWMTTVEAFSQTPPTEDLFNAHMATADRLQWPVPVETAHLHLYHPTHPDHSAAMKLFTNTVALRQMVSRTSLKKETRGKSLDPASWLALLGHDTVTHLAQTGNAQDAEDIAEVLQSELPDVYDRIATPARLLGKAT